ncbi:heavy-metal-associated domain-containing protein [Glycomyces tenuis]|uniref:heavy-metal-associated domain-containing protein n=1 Tax=Glycomyces tenuis TaxID=58116 RepID=UPI0004060121|nr:heavy-metal-associated domain-containing protein [Glycomyces tenuis]
MITVDYSLVAFRVTGLTADTCDHCIDSLKAELVALVGVLGVDILPAQGTISVLVDDLSAVECAADALWEAGWDAVGDRPGRLAEHY